MLGYSHGFAEIGSEYGNARRDEEFWRFQFVPILEFLWKRICLFSTYLKSLSLCRSDLECIGDEESLEDCDFGLLRQAMHLK